EAARDLVDNWPNGTPESAVLVAIDVAADHGVDATDVAVRVPSVGEVRGDDVVVEVEVTMPAIGVSGMSVGSWHYTARATRRVDDRVTVSLRDHVGFSLLGVFIGGQRFDVQVHASAEPEERP